MLSSNFQPAIVCFIISHPTDLAVEIVHSDCEFVVHLFLLAQYLKLLEETSFIGRKGDFLYMLLFGGAHLTMSAFIGRTLPYMDDSFAKNRFLSSSLIFMLASHIRL